MLCSVNAFERPLLFAFLISFFVFLLGRDVLEQVFSYKVEAFPREANDHAYAVMLLFLLSLILVHAALSPRLRRDYKKVGVSSDYTFYRRAALIVYYATLPFAIISRLYVTRYVVANGYTNYYLDYSDYLAGNAFLYLLSKIDVAMPIAFYAFLAARPSKADVKLPVCLYVFYLVVTLGGGQRSPAILGFLFLAVYFMARQADEPGGHWVGRSAATITVFAFPIAATALSWFNALRFEDTYSQLNPLWGMIDFFYDQGVTSNILKHAYIYRDLIPSDKLYTLEFIRSGTLARLLGITTYHGNTVEHALHGGSFAHSFGYVLLRDAYLAGRGTGTSCLAELYQDFGMTGVGLGGALYGALIASFDSRRPLHNAPSGTVLLIIVPQILWAPRGSFSGFITVLFYPSTIGILVIIAIVAAVLRQRSNNGGIPKTKRKASRVSLTEPEAL